MTAIVLWYDLPCLMFPATVRAYASNFLVLLEKRDRWVFLPRPARPFEVPSFPHVA